jgi:hypothetical protein
MVVIRERVRDEAAVWSQRVRVACEPDSQFSEDLARPRLHGRQRPVLAQDSGFASAHPDTAVAPGAVRPRFLDADGQRVEVVLSLDRVVGDEYLLDGVAEAG